MNKFILHGGGGQLTELSDVLFYRECVNDFEKEKVIKVLSVPFAAFNQDVRQHNFTAEYLFRTLQSNLYWVNPLRMFDIKTANWQSSEELENELRWADIIYVHGGNGDVLQEYFANVDLRKVIKNKICTGYSAGSNMWASKYYSNDNGKVMHGLGVLDVATFCHYTPDKWPMLNTLIAESPELNVIPITDGGYVVVCD